MYLSFKAGNEQLEIFFGSLVTETIVMDPKGRLSSEIHFLVPLRKNKKKEVFRKKIGVN